MIPSKSHACLRLTPKHEIHERKADEPSQHWTTEAGWKLPIKYWTIPYQRKSFFDREAAERAKLVTGVFVDFETGGFSPKDHGIASIAYSYFVIDPITGDFLITDPMQVFGFDDKKMYTTEALEVNGLDLEWLKTNGEKIPRLMSFFTEYLTSCFGVPIISVDGDFNTQLTEVSKDHNDWDKMLSGKVNAHNADFDWGFAKEGLDTDTRNEYPVFTKRPNWVCTKHRIMQGIALGIFPQGQLTSLGTFCGQYNMAPLSETKYHSAIGDVIQGIRVLAYLMSLEYEHWTNLIPK